MVDYSVVGKSVGRSDAYDKVTGRGQYVDDLKLPGMLYGRILRSPHAHARIRNIDISKASKLLGVKAVITGKDILPRKFGALPRFADQYPICIDKVHYVGDEVAAVAAVDLDTAEEALSLIDIEYEVLPAVFDPLEAMKPGAPLVHDDNESNVTKGYLREFGNIEEGFREADYIREDTFRTQMVAHAPLEPHGALANYDVATGEITLWAPKQFPFFNRRVIAHLLGIDESKVRIIVPYVGGGFGGKGEVQICDFCAAFLSMKTGRPVKIIYTREESLTCTRGRHPMIITLKTGVKKDGTIMAQHYKVIADGGAYYSTGPLAITLSGYFAMLPFRVPNMLFDGYHVYTNKQAAGPLRGHGGVQVRFAAESQFDMIAEDLGLDPAEFRLKNVIKANEPHPAGLTIRSCGLYESIQEATKAIGWGKRMDYQDSGTGMGIACSGYVSGINMMSHVGAGAIIHLHRNGAATLLVGACDLGQGSSSVLAQIAAEGLGMRYEDIRVTSADTELTPMDPGTFGSGVTMRAGNAVKMAAEAIKEKLLSAVAPKIGVEKEELLIRAEGLYKRTNLKQPLISLKEAIKIYQYQDLPMPIVGSGFYHQPVKESTTLLSQEGDISSAYSFGSQVAVVQVDRETGDIQLNEVISAHDSGFIINPLAAEGQFDGSIVFGIGQALYEEFFWDQERGMILNPSFLDYKVPTAMEFPKMSMIEIQTFEPEGPYGAKEAGEGTQVFTLPAISNAIYNAIGVRFKDLPITPEKVLAALVQQENVEEKKKYKEVRKKKHKEVKVE